MEPPKYDGGVRATSKTGIFAMQDRCYCHLLYVEINITPEQIVIFGPLTEDFFLL
jgi:hypothetical protein